MFYWVMKTIFIGPVVNLLFRPWVKGMDNIPESGPAVLVSNHLSFSDSIFLPLAVPRPVSFLAKSDYFNGKGLKGKLTAAFFRLSNQLPMDRSGGAASASSLKAGVDVLENGGLLGIYPEGTRSPDGRLYRGKTGVAKLVLSTGVPVIPVAMIGTDKVQPIGRRIPNIRRIGIIVGRPLDFSRYAGLENDRFVQRAVTDEIMYELMRLSGQEYVDVYASTVKEQLAARKGGKAAEARGAAVRLSAGKGAGPATGGSELPTESGDKLPGTVTVIGSAKGSRDAARGKQGKRAADAPEPDGGTGRARRSHTA
ncbi:1-acyl-sn-glycerol-3-phosphate acyltransferase [Arthrobacter sp. zg-Y40]|uniref:lysophospholipid acyltransferase family protein n=1 Tax=Arthrobacter sp. zg-Y40 TaxID=2886939 RepID=UPI001D13F003|nr:1-acyl-sn-glycerol-3-phosphate acyltransferase [Arthrobacter sp. zg-Y40]